MRLTPFGRLYRDKNVFAERYGPSDTWPDDHRLSDPETSQRASEGGVSGALPDYGCLLSLAPGADVFRPRIVPDRVAALQEIKAASRGVASFCDERHDGQYEDGGSEEIWPLDTRKRIEQLAKDRERLRNPLIMQEDFIDKVWEEDFRSFFGRPSMAEIKRRRAQRIIRENEKDSQDLVARKALRARMADAQMQKQIMRAADRESANAKKTAAEAHEAHLREMARLASDGRTDDWDLPSIFEDKVRHKKQMPRRMLTVPMTQLVKYAHGIDVFKWPPLVLDIKAELGRNFAEPDASVARLLPPLPKIATPEEQAVSAGRPSGRRSVTAADVLKRLKDDAAEEQRKAKEAAEAAKAARAAARSGDNRQLIEVGGGRYKI